jgi:hypothetical protein
VNVKIKDLQYIIVTMLNQGSLIKYNTPTLVSTTSNDKSKNKKKGGQAVERKTTQTEDILNSILPPR